MILIPKLSHRVDPAFAHALDQISQGIGFFDHECEPIYQNAWLQRAVGFPNGAELERTLCSFVADLRELALDQRLTGRACIEQLRASDLPLRFRPVRRMTGSFIGHDLFGSGPAFFVSIETSRELLPPPADVRARFGLTQSETRVAYYIAEDLRNEQIAEILSISPHTVRRHTEKVLAKVKAQARADIAARLRQAVY